MTSVSFMNIQLAHQSLEEAFPEVDAGVIPLGPRILVQYRRAKNTTRGGIILIDDARQTEKWNTQVAKVISVGELAFKSRKDGTPWPEGAWAKAGDFVRVPKYGGDKWEVDVPGDEKKPADQRQPALFAVFEDKDMIGRCTGNPLELKAFV